ncbi:MAG: NAD(P)-binding domain-containing protein [Candidatus Vogelbacteria bacterium]|nr:NAD(P)-binding domain-containing protein [Candidatus Vogelbacteria bacterium]
MTAEEEYNCEILIIGAGPAGIEAALQAKAKGLSYRLIDKNDIGSLIAETMRDKRFYHAYGRNSASVKGAIAFPDRALGDELVRLWTEQIDQHAFSKGVAARGVTRDDRGIFTVATNRGDIRTRFILLASGIFEHPRALGIPGEEGNPNVRYRFDYRENGAGKNIIVVGGGNSALETAIQCADENRVMLVVRKDSFAESATARNREEAQDLVQEGSLIISFDSTVLRIEGNSAILRRGAEQTTEQFDTLYIHIGYQKPVEFLHSLGISTTDDGVAVFDTITRETSVPGIFIAGSLTGTDSIIESANQAFDIVHSIASRAR